jgi:HEAT repeat protein
MRLFRFMNLVSCLLIGALFACHSSPGPLTADALVARVDDADGHVRRENRLAAFVVAMGLDSTDTDERTALLHMSRCGRDARDALAQLAAGSSDLAVSAMATLLTRRRRWIRQSRLYPFVHHDSSDVRALSVSLHGHRLSESTLRHLSTDIAPRVRHAAVIALCSYDDRETYALLADVLRRDPSPLVRQAVLQCGWSSVGNSMPDLIRTLDSDSSARVRESAAAALASLDTSSSLAALRHRIAGPMTEDIVMMTRYLAASGDTFAQQRIRDALTHSRPTIRALAISALPMALPEALETASLNALLDDPEVAIQAAQHLLTRDHHAEAAITRLVRIWRDGGLHADAAEQLLIRKSHPEVLQTVTAALTDETTDETHRRKLLERHRDAIALRPLAVRLMGHPHAELRYTAALNVLGFCR